MNYEFDCKKEWDDLKAAGVKFHTLSVGMSDKWFSVYVHIDSLTRECLVFDNQEYLDWKSRRALIHQKFEL
jgi:uncharacterized DUF497 family protein